MTRNDLFYASRNFERLAVGGAAVERYIGTKIVLAEPMTEQAFRDSRQSMGMTATQSLPLRDGYKVVYEDGYVSWSPRETFERAYRKITDAETKLVVTGNA